MKSILAAALLAVSVSGAALAQGTGSQGYFQIYNNTAGNTLVGFYTSEDGETWSDNWLSAELGPGESAQATFNAESGSCQQVFAAGWLATDGGEVVDDPFEINICDASNVYLGDNEISYD